jgi:hypothetical protein
LIQTGVAARPDETKALTDAFVADVFSNPQSAYEGNVQMEDFYKDFLKTAAPNQYDKFIKEIYGDEGASESPITADVQNAAKELLAKRRAKK